MPSRFDKYRVKDGVTRLGERFLNPVFQDIDIRLAALEELKIAWDGVVRTVSEFGLVRINDALAPAFADVNAASAEVEQKRLDAVAAVAALETIIANIQADAGADIDAWCAAKLEDLEAWKTSLDAALPLFDSRMTALESETELALNAVQIELESTKAKLPNLVQPDELGNFAIAAGAVDGQLAAVAGYGLYRYDSASSEAADGETVLQPSTGSGRWYLAAPHWDFVWAYLSGLFDDFQGEIEAAKSKAAAAVMTANAAALAAADKFSAKKVLVGRATLDFAFIPVGASVAINITVNGAETSDCVVLTPPSTLPDGIVPVVYISAVNTVTVRLNNVTDYTIYPAAATFLITVLKP